jgi:hypothetical protein
VNRDLARYIGGKTTDDTDLTDGIVVDHGTSESNIRVHPRNLWLAFVSQTLLEIRGVRARQFLYCLRKVPGVGSLVARHAFAPVVSPVTTLSLKGEQ